MKIHRDDPRKAVDRLNEVLEDVMHPINLPKHKQMKSPYIISVMVLLLSGCFSDASKRVLEENGYTNITITGPSFSIWCGLNYGQNDSFTALNPQGKSVSGSVCYSIGSFIAEDHA